MTRQETFSFLKAKDIPTVPNGIVAEFAPQFIQGLRTDLGVDDSPAIKVTDNIHEKPESVDLLARQVQRDIFERLCRLVVYIDPDKRNGEGMQVMDAYVALQQYPEHYCSQYRNITVDDSGFSRRILCIGNLGFVLEFASSDWRSHCGEMQTSVVHKFEGQRSRNMPYPIYAIDLVGDPALAVDFETTPSLAPVLKYMTQEEIDKEVESFLKMMTDDPTYTAAIQ
jgi:hypothetical protein